jgi:ribosomal protein L34E
VPVIGDEWRKARKEHKCNECGKFIQAGEVYHRLFGMAERGDPPYGIRICAACEERYGRKPPQREGKS